MGINVTSVFSALDSSSSLAALGFKDSANVAGLTAMAYKAGGEHEAREKFIDETGTSILWLGGIPACRWLFDKTIFKWSGLDPEISIKKLPKVNDTKKHQQLSFDELRDFTKKVGKISEEKLKTISDKQLVGKYKFMNVAKFLVSTALPSLLIVILPKLNQKLSRNIILNRTLKEDYHHSSNENKGKTNSPISFEKNVNSNASVLKARADNFFKSPNSLAFKGVGDVILNTAANAQVNPVGNILLVDGIISGNRVTFVPRNNQQRQENLIKEGGFLFFMFGAQKLMKMGFDWIAAKLKTPVDLDFKALSSDKFKACMKSATKDNLNQLTQFTETNAGISEEEAALNFIKGNHKKSEFLTLHTAKDLGIIQTTKTGEIDPRKYIETKEVEKLSKNIGNFAKAMLDSGLNPDEYIRKARNLKAGFLVANLAICTAALGYVLPKVQYAFRKNVYGSNEYPGVKGYAEEAKKMSKTV